MFIDTHCHIDEYDNLDEIVNNMKDNYMIISGANHETNQEVIDVIKKYSNVFGMIGIHPTEIDENVEEHLKYIEDHINEVVAVGEIGLDYHYGKENVLKQKEVFIYQLELAKKYNKPVVIHSRDAALDTYNILKEYSNLKKVMHCYSYSLEMAQKFININCKLGIGGVLTFKNSKTLKEVVTNVELENLLLETDSPYLSPEPYRGEKNVPYNVYYIGIYLANLLNKKREEIFAITTQNAVSLFDLKGIL